MTRVLVTGAGGAAGVAVIRALGEAGHEVVAADGDPRAVGLHLASAGAVIPAATAPDFAGGLLATVERTRPEALISTVAEEIPPLTAADAELEARDVAIWLPTLDAALDCVDKWRFAERARLGGLPAPATALGNTASGPGEAMPVPGPWVVKPRFGRGSRDVHLVDTEAGLAAACRAVPDPIVQTRCTGTEFTADVLVERGGAIAGLVPRWRLETKAGISTKGRTFRDPQVETAVAATLDLLGLEGVANVQGFAAEDGTVRIVEVNPRFSGGLPLSLAAGADLVGEFLRGTLGKPLRPERLEARVDVTMLRYYAEVFLEGKRAT